MDIFYQVKFFFVRLFIFAIALFIAQLMLKPLNLSLCHLQVHIPSLFLDMNWVFYAFVISLIIILHHFAKNRISISFKKGNLKFFPLLLEWEANYIYKLNEIPKPITDHVKWLKSSNREIDIVIQVDPLTLSIHFVVKQRSRLFPIRHKEISQPVEAFFLAKGVSVDSVSSTLSFKNWRYLGKLETVSSNMALIQMLQNSSLIQNDLSNANTWIAMKISIRFITETDSICLSVGYCTSGKKMKFVRQFFNALSKESFKQPTYWMYDPNVINRLTTIPNIQKKYEYHGQSSLSPKITQQITKNKGEKYVIAHIIQSTKPFPLLFDLNDYRLGGIIVGAPKTGKTTLKLHLIRQLLRANVNIIEIDIKGNTVKFEEFQQQSHIFVPGCNLSINLFKKPIGLSNEEYSTMLFQTLSSHNALGGELSPSQKEILHQAIQKTVAMDGTPKDFFNHLLNVGFILQNTLDNHQNHSALALVAKFYWMQTDFKKIFWTPDSNFSPQCFERSVFFDFSKIAASAPPRLIQFLLETILMYLKIYLEQRKKNGQPSSNSPSHALFIDEGQAYILKNGFSQYGSLEMSLSSLNIYDIPFIFTGISDDCFSPSFLNQLGFIARFRSQLKNENPSFNGLSMTNLADYEFVFYAKSCNYSGLMAQTIPFKGKNVDHQNFANDRIQKTPSILLDDIFAFTPTTINVLRICSLVNHYPYTPSINEIEQGNELLERIIDKSNPLSSILNIHAEIQNGCGSMNHENCLCARKVITLFALLDANKIRYIGNAKNRRMFEENIVDYIIWNLTKLDG